MAFGATKLFAKQEDPAVMSSGFAPRVGEGRTGGARPKEEDGKEQSND
jgi:hypothetical protein